MKYVDRKCVQFNENIPCYMYRLNAAATINLVTDMMRRLFEGGVYSRAVFIVFRRVVKMADGVYEYTIDCHKRVPCVQSNVNTFTFYS